MTIIHGLASQKVLHNASFMSHLTALTVGFEYSFLFAIFIIFYLIHCAKLGVFGLMVTFCKVGEVTSGHKEVTNGHGGAWKVKS